MVVKGGKCPTLCKKEEELSGRRRCPGGDMPRGEMPGCRMETVTK